jgi:hypothetical protein
MKILHLSFHKGCINDFHYVCNKLGHECEVLSSFKECCTNSSIDPLWEPDSKHYMITHDSAIKYWNRYKDYFYQFDVVVTSDTAILSRIFLQNGWTKPLVIWICNRFDYFHAAKPDNEYFELFQRATKQPNVQIIGYTAFENVYCRKAYGIEVGDTVITPSGGISDTYKFHVSRPDVANTLFVPPYHNDTKMMNLTAQLQSMGFSAYCGKYNGPMDLTNYKAVVHIPYAWSNLAQYVTQFESWEDLQTKIHSLNYESHKAKLIEYGKKHEKEVCEKWNGVFSVKTIILHDHEGGFFSCCSVKMDKIVSYINNFKEYPTSVDSSKLFRFHKPDAKIDVTYDFFEYKEDTHCVSKIPINFHNSYQFNPYKHLDYDSICPIINKYFSPSGIIKDIKKRIIAQYKLIKENTIAVYYRGTDKIKETSLASYDQFVNKIKSIRNEERILLITDQKQCIDFFKGHFDDLVIINELRVSSGSNGIHLENEAKTNYDEMFILFASFLIISESKQIVCSSGNCSFWFMLYRGNGNGIHQYLHNKWV